MTETKGFFEREFVLLVVELKLKTSSLMMGLKKNGMMNLSLRASDSFIAKFEEHIIESK